MNSLKDNLRIALSYLSIHKCTSIQHYIGDYSPAPFCLVSDASEMFGLGGYFGNLLAWQWPLWKVEDFLSITGGNIAWASDIAFLEFLAAIITEVLAFPRLKRTTAYMLVDSVVATSWLRKLRTRRPDCKKYQVAMISRRFKLRYAIKPVRIPGESNANADDLSRKPLEFVQLHGKAVKVFEPSISSTGEAMFRFSTARAVRMFIHVLNCSGYR